MARPAREDGRNARTAANQKYNTSAYYRPPLNVKKDQEQMLKDYAESKGETISGLINRLLAAEIPGFVPIGNIDNNKK